ncbi:hypothetical protein [Streptomyces ureilyticus]|uniref:Uncharacterized protein n=1 Tax=Streptomyces ureilyticus TaxID=1775131 RepID=A0ABX0E4J1_9ACTN|nr:hypothetical protein [Streptomyces ureilyticus]NGO49136.1 hypothetical protein [Streptomyces ureilyticus]
MYAADLGRHGERRLDPGPLDVEVQLDASQAGFDRHERRYGSSDAHGSGFTFVVNGERLFVRAMNWAPDDVFPSRITRERYRTGLTQAAEAGASVRLGEPGLVPPAPAGGITSGGQ